MGQQLRQLKKRRNTKKKIEEILDRASTSLVVHYSCESFYDRTDGKTPRVTSIAVRNLDSGQTQSYSIHKIAEQKKIPFDEIASHYDELEKEMLSEFFEFTNTHQHYNWIHWNMRDMNYGFAALEHRFRVLGGEPISITEDKKFDLARTLVELYGVDYIGHPRLERLIEKNKITDRDFLSGKQEADAFDSKEFIVLHQSTLRKVDIMANIFGRLSDGSIKTNAKWSDVHGIHPEILVEIIKEHWAWSGVVIIAIIIGLVKNVF